MKNIIGDIISTQNQIVNYDNLIFKKENDILSCIKSVNEEGIENRQKQAAYSLLKLREKKQELLSLLNKLLQKLDIDSFNKKNVTSSLIYKAIGEGIKSDELKILKQVYKNLK